MLSMETATMVKIKSGRRRTYGSVQMGVGVVVTGWMPAAAYTASASLMHAAIRLR